MTLEKGQLIVNLGLSTSDMADSPDFTVLRRIFDWFDRVARTVQCYGVDGPQPQVFSEQSQATGGFVMCVRKSHHRLFDSVHGRFAGHSLKDLQQVLFFCSAREK